MQKKKFSILSGRLCYLERVFEKNLPQAQLDWGNFFKKLFVLQGDGSGELAQGAFNEGLFFFLASVKKMPYAKYYSVKTMFGELGPITIKDLVRDYNALLDKAGWGKGYHLNVGSVHGYIRNGNTLGHFRNIIFRKCHGTLTHSIESIK